MTQQDPWATPPHESAQGPTLPPAPHGAPTSTQNDWMGIVSLVLSLATFVTGITWIAGIVLGHLGLAAARRGEASNRSVALAGAVIGWVFAGLTVLVIVGFVLFVLAVGSS